MEWRPSGVDAHGGRMVDTHVAGKCSVILTAKPADFTHQSWGGW